MCFDAAHGYSALVRGGCSVRHSERP